MYPSMFLTLLSLVIATTAKNEQAVTYSSGIDFHEKHLAFNPLNLATWSDSHVAQAMEAIGLSRFVSVFRFHHISGPVHRVAVEKDEKLAELGLLVESDKWRLRKLVLDRELPANIYHWQPATVLTALRYCGLGPVSHKLPQPLPDGKLFLTLVKTKKLDLSPIEQHRLDLLLENFDSTGTATAGRRLTSEALEMCMLLCALGFSFIGCSATTSSLTGRGRSVDMYSESPTLRLPVLSWYASGITALALTVCTVYFQFAPLPVLGAQMLLGIVSTLIFLPSPKYSHHKQLV